MFWKFPEGKMPPPLVARTNCFSGQVQVAQKFWKKKSISTQWKSSRQLCFFRASASFFIVNTSEFAYFFFKSGESHERRQWLLVPPLTGWLSQWAVHHKLCWWALAVQLPLCQLCNLHVSYRVGLMFIYTFNNVLLCSRIP